MFENFKASDLSLSPYLFEQHAQVLYERDQLKNMHVERVQQYCNYIWRNHDDRR